MASIPPAKPRSAASRTGSPGRGFASQDPERQREVADPLLEEGEPRPFTPHEKREALRKGGLPVGSNPGAGADHEGGSSGRRAR